MVNIGNLFNDLMNLIGLKYYNKDECDGKYATEDHNHTEYLTSHQDISGKEDKTNKKNEIPTDATLSSENVYYPTMTAVRNYAQPKGSYVTTSDSRLSDARTPTSHTHGNITNDGKVGTDSGKIITTGTGGLLQASSSISKSMINDFPSAMTPTSHEHSTTDVKDNSAYTSIGSSANSTQKTINDKINTALGLKADSNNVYSKSETYTQSEITTLISNAVSNLDLFEVVSSLPSSNIKSNRLYLIVNDATITNNSYDIYLRVNNSWEQLDSLEFDISNFYNKTEVDTLLNGKVDTSDSRLTNARTPTSHSHGNISNTGTLSGKSKNVVTDSNGTITTEDKLPIPTKTSDLTNDSGFLTSHNPIDSSLSSTSTNAVQNKVISNALDGKSDTGHTHSLSNLSKGEQELSIDDISGLYNTLDGLVAGKSNTGHTHGSLNSAGTLNSDISSVNKIAVTDSSNNLKTISQLPYSKISGTPSVPSKTSDLTNDSGFVTISDVDLQIGISNITTESTTQKVTAWSDPTNDTNYPSEKLVKDSLDTKLESSDLLDLIYPVGSIYFDASNHNVCPIQTLLGGTWTRIEDKFLLSSGSTYSATYDNDGFANKTGGSADAVVVEHNHTQNAHTHTQNEHTHTQNAHTHTQNAHTHTQDAHTHTQDAHTHTQASHTHTTGDSTYKYFYAGKVHIGTSASKKAHTNSNSGVYLVYSDDEGGNTIKEYTSIQSVTPTINSTTATNQTTVATNQNTTATNQNTTATNQNTTATNQNTTATNNATGESGTGKNMPPYLVVNVWKRTQ